MDLSELFKTGFQNLHKQNLEKNYQQKTLKNRMEDFSCLRRQTRDTLLSQKRNLDLNNMSPYITPEPERVKKTSHKIESVKTKAVDSQQKPKKVETSTNKRLEMLKKWKEDKAKRLQEEKKKAKPIFKVCHITSNPALPKFEKDKTIKPQEKFVSKFAPKDHKFHAPKNIKPLNMVNSEKVSNKQVLNQYKSKNILTSKDIETRQKIQGSKLNKDKSKINLKLPQRDASHKNIKKSLSKENICLSKNQAPDISKYNITKNVQKTVSTTPAKTKKKAVEWNLPKKKESENGKTNVDKKIYQKTPRKRKNGTTNVDQITSSGPSQKTPIRNKNTHKPIIEKEVIYSDDEISLKTPVKKHSKSSDRSGCDNEMLHGTINDKLKKKTSSPERNTAFVDTENQMLTKNLPLTFNNSEEKSHSPSKFNHTPKNTRKSLHNKEHLSPVNYISPFVTISRGKDSARKEFKVRQSTGGTFSETPEGRQDFSARTSPKMGAEYFSKTLNKEIMRIESICTKWEKYKENDIPEEAINLIDVAVGQSKLLIAKKFEQFRSLIEECRSLQYKEKPITCTDLHGFWDMVYMQVEDLDKRFANLETLKDNDWKEVITEKKVTAVKKQRGRPKKVTASSSLKDAIRAARNKRKQQDNDLVENPEIIITKSPVRERSTPNLPSSLRRSLRVSLLNGQAKSNSKRASSSPGLTMMKVTQAIKSGDGITPSRSILKTNLNKSEKRITKSVLFKEYLEEDVENKKPSDVSNEADKENDATLLNPFIFSPVTPTRRSKRLGKKSEPILLIQ